MLRAEEVALAALFLATLPRGIVLDEILMLPAALGATVGLTAGARA